MKKILLILAVVALGGCAPLLSALTTTPATVANQTVLDEQVAITVELAYKAARLAGETAVEAGYIKGERATKVAELDNRAYQAVLAVRAAYAAGNSTSYIRAAADATTAIRALTDAIKGGN